MYQIKQFKPSLYALLLLGMIGFAIASRSSPIFLLGCGGVALNGWLVYTGRFRPLPRLFANIVTLVAMAFIARQFSGGSGREVLVIGQFLVVLQLVKLWEQRLNRDYAQLLVLSLLLMVAASISTSSLLFGVLMVVYLFLSLYCCLLFHLKVETDKAVAAYALPQEKMSPAVLKQDQRHLSRSMRRLSIAISTGSIATAVVVFLLFPRGAASGLIPPPQLRGGSPLTGFGDQMKFDQIARIQQNERIVAYAEVTKNDRKLGAGDVLYLRGISNDRYVPRKPLGHWERTGVRDYPPIGVNRDTQIPIRRPYGRNFVPPPEEPVAEDYEHAVYRQKISLSPTGTRVLFAVPGAQMFTPHRDIHILYGSDGTIQSEDPLNSPIDYDVVSSGQVEDSDLDTSQFFFNRLSPDFQFEEVELPAVRGQPVRGLRIINRLQNPSLLRFFGPRDGDVITSVDGKLVADIPQVNRQSVTRDAYREGRPLIVLREGVAVTLPSIPLPIEQFARRPDVSGADESGRPLAASRDRLRIGPDVLDEDIAHNIEAYLRSQFTYTLDITDARTRNDLDPLVWFLSDDGHRGHCEYFAGAMTLMCQTLGMNARVVLGFKCDEYNPFSQQFIIRQSHAHAWVEVRTIHGWKMFDPTSSRGAEAVQHEYGLWQQAKHLFNWLEFTYANSVIAYDNESREGLIQSIEGILTKPLYRGVNEGWITRKFTDSRLYQMLTHPDSSLVVGICSAIVFSVAGVWAYRRWRRWQLRKRAARMGLEAMPDQERLWLAWQLAFYDDLMRLLECRKMVRATHQTPLEFARSLFALPSDAYESVRRLTEVFYRVRYGRVELSPGQRRRLGNVVTRLDGQLEQLP